MNMYQIAVKLSAAAIAESTAQNNQISGGNLAK